MADTPQIVGVVDANAECLTLDATIKHLGRMMQALNHIRETRKVPTQVLEILPDIHLTIKTLVDDLVQAVKHSDSQLKVLITVADPNGLPATRDVTDSTLINEAQLLRKQNYSLDQIAQRLGQPVSRITRLLQTHAAAPPATRMDQTHNAHSIFNFQARLEEHGTRISRLLQACEAESIKDAGIASAAMVGELTKLYKLAMDLQERVENYNQRRIFKEALLAALDRVDVGFRDKVLEEMARIAKEGGDIL